MGHVILGLLMALGPQTLYSLNKAFQAGAGLFYSASHGALQHALRGLVAAEWVTVTETTSTGRLKKEHTITTAGIAEFHRWISSPLEGDLEVAALARLFHLGLVRDAADRRAIVANIIAGIQTQIEGLEALRAELQAQELPAELADIFHFQIATLDYGLNAHRAALSWFEELHLQPLGGL